MATCTTCHDYAGSFNNSPKVKGRVIARAPEGGEIRIINIVFEPGGEHAYAQYTLHVPPEGGNVERGAREILTQVGEMRRMRVCELLPEFLF